MTSLVKKLSKKRVVPKFIIFVVYKSKDSYWRGFCSPFDVSCEGQTKEIVMKRLEGLVDLYVSRLKKYNFAKHLSIKQLSDEKDREIFNYVLRKVSADFEEKIREKYTKFQEMETEEFTLRNPQVSGYYQQAF